MGNHTPRDKCESMNVLLIGDIFGNPGRNAARKLLPGLKKKHQADFVIVNCENAAHGKGITDTTARDIFEAGADVLTGGNHIFAQRGCDDYIEKEHRLVRPINFPPGTIGRGSAVYNSEAGFQIAVINACGRVFMGNYDDPFRTVDREVERLRKITPLIFLDFHAEATSEKVAMGWYLDGRVTAVVGTHTHIPTADECILDQGTAYITDLGMTGPYDSVIGVDKDIILDSILTMRHTKFEVAQPRRVRICGVLVTADPLTGRATSIKRVREDLPDPTN